MTVLEIMESSGLSRNAVSIRLRSLKERGLIEGIAKPKSPKQALPPGAKQLGFAGVVLVRKDRFAFCRPIRRHHKGAEQHEQKCGRLIPCEDIHADENRRDRCHNRLQVHINPRGNPRLNDMDHP